MPKNDLGFGKVSSKLNKEISTIEKIIKELKDYGLIKNGNNKNGH